MLVRILLITASVLSTALLIFRKNAPAHQAIQVSSLCGMSAIFFALTVRFFTTGNPIGAGMVESLGLYVFFLYGVAFIVRRVVLPRRLVIYLASFVSLLIGFLPSSMFVVGHFAPILNSLWFYVHLPLFFAGYAALTLDFSCVIVGERAALTASFLLLVAGLISGGFWAFFAWGVPWSWDAKECWALGTIFFVGAAKRAHDDKLRNTFTVIAFCAMVFTFVGVAFLFSSRHAYQ